MIRNFFIRQIWRIKEIYRFFLPIIGIVNTILYFVIAIGVTNIFELTMNKLVIGILLFFFLFNLLGYTFDKLNLFSKDYEKMFEGMGMRMYGIQSDYLALLIVKYQNLTEEEIDKQISNHLITKTMEKRK